MSSTTRKEDRQSSDRAQDRPHYRDFSSFVARFEDWIENSDDPRLYFIHIEIPHAPWKYLPSGKTYHSSEIDSRAIGFNSRDSGRTWVNDEWLVTQGLQRHLLQVGFADKLLGDVIGRLQKTELYDRSLVIVVADHGVSFRAGGIRRRLSPGNLQDMMHVPLLVKLPHQGQGVVSDRNVQTIDILPTIAEVLDVVLPWRVDGKSLFDTSTPDRTELIVFADESRKLLTVAPVITEMYETLDRKLALFGPSESVDGVYRIGRYRHLIGQDLGVFSVDQAPDCKNLARRRILVAGRRS